MRLRSQLLFKVVDAGRSCQSRQHAVPAGGFVCPLIIAPKPVGARGFLNFMRKYFAVVIGMATVCEQHERDKCDMIKIHSIITRL